MKAGYLSGVLTRSSFSVLDLKKKKKKKNSHQEDDAIDYIVSLEGNWIRKFMNK